MELNKQVKAVMKVTHIIRVIRPAVVALGIVFALSSPAFADAPYGGGNVQGYATAAPLSSGTIVELTGKTANSVQISTSANPQNMFGVTVDHNQLLVSSSNDGLQNEVFVATSGTYNVLVSTQNGPIAAGDYVTISTINGVGMKATTDQKTVLGRATAAFDGKGVTLGTMAVKDVTGSTTQTVAIGSIAVTINVESNPNVKSTKVNVPPWLQRIGEQIAEKQVDPIRIYLSVAITAASIIAAVAMLYAGVRNSVISIGRNPMSRKSIFRALLQVILSALLILIIGLFAVYLLLKL